MSAAVLIWPWHMWMCAMCVLVVIPCHEYIPTYISKLVLLGACKLRQFSTLLYCIDIC